MDVNEVVIPQRAQAGQSCRCLITWRHPLHLKGLSMCARTASPSMTTHLTPSCSPPYPLLPQRIPRTHLLPFSRSHPLTRRSSPPSTPSVSISPPSSPPSPLISTFSPVSNVDKNAAYPAAVDDLKADEQLPETTKLRQVKYLNNRVEQDHRFIKRLTKPGMGFGSFNTARRTLRGMEAMNMIRKGQVQGVAKGNVRAQTEFVSQLFGIVA